jgi:serine/threonine-protein kinase
VIATPLDTLVPIAEGSIGRVYVARESATGERVAVKMLHRADAAQVARLKREAAAQQRLDHPNICRVRGVETDDDGHWRLLMDYVPGSTLAQEMGRLPLDRRIGLIATVCDALAHAHDAGILHRDLKPANILLRETPGGGWDPVVADFGLALGTDDPALTSTGEILGSPAYMSPEQARGDPDAIGPASDIFSIGCILYEALAGKPPFDAPSVSASLEKLLGSDPPHPRRVNPHAPEALSRIALQCLEREPRRRYRGMRALADDLSRWRHGEPVRARRYTRLHRLRQRAARQPVTASLALAAALAIFALGAWGAWTASSAALRERSAATLGATIAEVRSRMTIARLAPAHDIGEDRARLARELADLRGRYAGQPRIADLLHTALATGHLAIGNLAEADDHSARALEARATPEARAVRIRALLARYADAIAPIVELPADQRAERMVTIRQRYLQPAEAELAALDDPSRVPAETLARLAILEGRFDQARRRIDELEPVDAQDYAPDLLRGRLLLARAEAALAGADRERAESLFREAVGAFDAVAVIGRSDPRSRVLACRAARGGLRATMLRGGPVPDSLPALHPGCAGMLELDPGDPALHAAQAATYATLAAAYEAVNQREPARAMLRRGLASVERALALDESDAAALEQRARLYLRLAGLEPEPWTRAQAHFDAAAEAARRLQQTRPGYPAGRLLTALTERDRARHLELHNRPDEALAALGRAQTAFEAVLELTPDSTVALSGAALNAVFHFYEYRPDDPDRAVRWMERAIALQQRALDNDPDNVDLLFDQGANHGDLWYYLLLTPEAEAGLSREQLLARAMSLLARIRELAPQRPGGYSQPIMILLSGASWRIDRGEDASAELERALELKRAADRAGVALDRNIPAWIQLSRVRNRLAQGGDAEAVFEAAFEAIEDPDVDPSDRFYLLMHRLELIGLYQRWRRETGREPDPARFAEARAALDDLLANDRRQAGVLCSGGRVLLEQLRAGQADRRPALERAEALFEECLQTDDDFAPRYRADLEAVRELRAGRAASAERAVP